MYIHLILVHCQLEKLNCIINLQTKLDIMYVAKTNMKIKVPIKLLFVLTGYVLGVGIAEKISILCSINFHLGKESFYLSGYKS